MLFQTVLNFLCPQKVNKGDLDILRCDWIKVYGETYPACNRKCAHWDSEIQECLFEPGGFLSGKLCAPAVLFKMTKNDR